MNGRGYYRGGGNGRRGWNSSPNFSNDAGGFKGGYYCTTDPGLSYGGLNVDPHGYNQFSFGPGPNSQALSRGPDSHNSVNAPHNNFGLQVNNGGAPQAFSADFGSTHFANWASHNTSSDMSFFDTCAFVDSWIPDSGATNHMTPNPKLVHGAVPYTGPETVIVGNDKHGNYASPHSAYLSTSLFALGNHFQICLFYNLAFQAWSSM